MGVKLFRAIAIAATVSAGMAWAGAGYANAQSSSTPPSPSDAATTQQGHGRGMGMGGFGGGARGMLGTVTEATADHYTIKTDSGDLYTVHFSVNTRMMKQGPGRGSGRGPGQDQAGGNGASGGRRGASVDGSDDASNRPAPQTIKPADIHIGDIITAGGEIDSANKSIGAVFIALVDPERAKQMREMQANYGKTWLAGRITAIHETTITIEGMIDHAPHSIVVDENTSFRQRRDSITLADIQPGEQLRAEGAVKSGVFLATTVTAMQPQNRDSGPGPAPGQAPGAGSGPGSKPGPQ